MEKQISLSGLMDELSQAKTKKKEFLTQMENLIPWGEWVEIVDTGLIHTLKTTASNVHDVTMTPELLSGDEATVYGDSGYLGAEKRERVKSSVRVKVEHVFAVVKNRFRYRKTRYRGLQKQAAKLNMVFALANLHPIGAACQTSQTRIAMVKWSP